MPGGPGFGALQCEVAAYAAAKPSKHVERGDEEPTLDSEINKVESGGQTSPAAGGDGTGDDEVEY